MDPSFALSALLNLPDPTLILNDAHTVQLVSRSAESLFVEPAASFVGESIFEFVHESCHERLRRTLNGAVHSSIERDSGSPEGYREHLAKVHGAGGKKDDEEMAGLDTHSFASASVTVSCKAMGRKAGVRDGLFTVDITASAWHPPGSVPAISRDSISPGSPDPPEPYWYILSLRELLSCPVARDVSFEGQDPRMHHANVIRGAMLETCDLAISGLTADGSLVVSNTAARQLFQCNEAESGEGVGWVGKRWRMWDEHFTRELPLEDFPIARVVRGEAVPEANYNLQLPDGTKRFVFLGGSPVYDADGTLVGGTLWAKDMTQQREQEQHERDADAAVKSAEYYRQVCDLMPVLMWTTDADGHLDWWNQMWYEYTGVPCQDALDYKWTKYIHPEDLPRVIDAWNTAWKTKDEYHVEWRLKRRDGEWRWVAASATPKRENGQVVRWYGLLMDMHEGMLAYQKSRLMTQQVLFSLGFPPSLFLTLTCIV